MSDSNILPRDQNHITTAGFENSLVSGDVRPGQMIVATGRIKVDTAGGGSGTVTEIDTTAPISGGPITTTGTITTSMTTNKLIGRATAGTGVMEEITLGTNLSFTGTTLNAADAATAIVVGTTTITSGTNTRILYDNSGVVGEYTVTGTGTTAVLSTSPTFTTSANINGAAATNRSLTFQTATSNRIEMGASNAAESGANAGSDFFINTYDDSGVYIATPLVLTRSSGLLTLNDGLTVTGNTASTTFNKVTITAPASGSTLVIADGKTLTANHTLTINGGDSAVLAIAASKTLTVSNTLTFTGTDSSSVAFGTGGTVLYSTSTIPLTVGTTTIASGTNTRILYDNSGVLGEYTLTGSGTVVVMQNTPTLTTPVLGVATATSINGLTITTTTGTLTMTNAKTLSVTNILTLSGTDSTTMTFPTTTATIARTDAAQTFTGTQTFSQVITTANAITASGNAATVPVTSRHNIVTNNSAATLTITLTTTSAVNMQTCVVQILDSSAAAQTITWVNTEDSTVAAPTTSNGSTTLPLTVGFMYNNGTSKWRTIAKA